MAENSSDARKGGVSGRDIKKAVEGAVQRSFNPARQQLRRQESEFEASARAQQQALGAQTTRVSSQQAIRSLNRGAAVRRKEFVGAIAGAQAEIKNKAIEVRQEFTEARKGLEIKAEKARQELTKQIENRLFPKKVLMEKVTITDIAPQFIDPVSPITKKDLEGFTPQQTETILKKISDSGQKVATPQVNIPKFTLPDNINLPNAPRRETIISKAPRIPKRRVSSIDSAPLTVSNVKRKFSEKFFPEAEAERKLKVNLEEGRGKLNKDIEGFNKIFGGRELTAEEFEKAQKQEAALNKRVKEFDILESDIGGKEEVRKSKVGFFQTKFPERFGDVSLGDIVSAPIRGVEGAAENVANFINKRNIQLDRIAQGKEKPQDFIDVTAAKIFGRKDGPIKTDAGDFRERSIFSTSSFKPEKTLVRIATKEEQKTALVTGAFFIPTAGTVVLASGTGRGLATATDPSKSAEERVAGTVEFGVGAAVLGTIGAVKVVKGLNKPVDITRKVTQQKIRTALTDKGPKIGVKSLVKTPKITQTSTTRLNKLFGRPPKTVVVRQSQKIDIAGVLKKGKGTKVSGKLTSQRQGSNIVKTFKVEGTVDKIKKFVDKPDLPKNTFFGTGKSVQLSRVTSTSSGREVSRTEFSRIFKLGKRTTAGKSLIGVEKTTFDVQVGGGKGLKIIKKLEAKVGAGFSKSSPKKPTQTRSFSDDKILIMDGAKSTKKFSKLTAEIIKKSKVQGIDSSVKSLDKTLKGTIPKKDFGGQIIKSVKKSSRISPKQVVSTQSTVASVPINRVRSVVIPLPITTNVSAFQSAVAFFSSQSGRAFAQGVSQADEQKKEQLTKLIQEVVQDDVVSDKPATGSRSQSATKTATTTQTQTVVQTTTIPSLITIPRTSPPRVPFRALVPATTPSSSFTGISAKVQRRAYDVFVKAGGKFKKVADDLPLGVALKKGATVTKNTIASRFKVVLDKKARTKKKDVAFSPNPALFRTYRISKGRQIPLPQGPTTYEFIERRRKRLTTGGEKREILGFKRAARGGRNVFGF